MRIQLELNGDRTRVDVEPRDILADTLREACGLTSVHLGCEHGSCGACTIEIDGQVARSCLILSIAAEGRPVRTLDGLAEDPVMQALKQSFHRKHALQCGFCTPGMLMIARDMIRRHDRLDEATVREGLAGHICRCTGYVGIVDAILDAHASLSDRHADSQADNQAGDRAGDRADHHHETRRAG